MMPADAATVFVVDDDPSVRTSIQGLLKSASYGPNPSGRRRNSCAASDRMGQVVLFWT